MSEHQWTAILLTFKLAITVTFILLIICTPLAYWLARTKNKFKPVLNAIFALPLVLPPTVIGFYLLVAFGPNGLIGQTNQSLGLSSLLFSFKGLVIASCVYSLPFVLQPIQNSIASIGKSTFELASVSGLSPLNTFFKVVVPQAKLGFITACVLGFAHTVGEFGLVLIIGGNIPGQTQLVSLLIFEHIEALEYTQAHKLSLFMLIFSFVILFVLYWFNQRKNVNWGNVK
ncbi:MAG: molybdate ABC transporter permease subunit [Saccharospirillaceae bacterium]|nr:molybdate ABC transporter permease subunit [Pseudomonadales bacterium]NRB80487.1 molybdate ABC transporter permease subunit [Saccharospirillaceae bacterium]